MSEDTQLGDFETHQIENDTDARADGGDTPTETTDHLAERTDEKTTRETPEPTTQEMPETPDMNDENDTTADTEQEQTDDGYTRKRMNIQRGDGPDQRGDVTVEVVRENADEAREIMADVMPSATALLMDLLELSDEETEMPEQVTEVPADENGYVRIRMNVQRGDGPDQRGDTNTEEVGRDPNGVFQTVATDMKDDVEMLTDSLGL